MKTELGRKILALLQHNQEDRFYGLKPFLFILFVITLLRWFFSLFMPVPVTPDEGLYALYSRDLSWVYYSKPPGLPFFIHIGEFLFGMTRFGLRFFSPIFHAGAALCLYHTAFNLYRNRKIAFYSGMIYALSTGVIFASALSTSDTPLLFGYALALCGFLGYVSGGSFKKNLFLLSAGLTFAFYSKYAAIYFVLSAVISCLFVDKNRRKAAVLFLLSGILICFVMLTPHWLVLLKNHFVTLYHIKENADLSWQSIFDFSSLFQFIAEQFSVFHPVYFPFSLLILYRIYRGEFSDKEKILSIFILTPLAIILTQAFLNRAHANWAAPAYLAASILCAYAIVKARFDKILLAGTLVSVFSFFLFPVLCAFTHYFSFYAVSALDPARRFRHMNVFAEIIEENMLASGDYFLVTDRKNGALIAYFSDDEKLRNHFYGADIDGKPDHHFELKYPITAENAKGKTFIYALFSHYDIPNPDPKILEAFKKKSPPVTFSVYTHTDRKAYMILRELSDFQGIKK